MRRRMFRSKAFAALTHTEPGACVTTRAAHSFSVARVLSPQRLVAVGMVAAPCRSSGTIPTPCRYYGQALSSRS